MTLDATDLLLLRSSALSQDRFMMRLRVDLAAREALARPPEPGPEARRGAAYGTRGRCGVPGCECGTADGGTVTRSQPPPPAVARRPVPVAWAGPWAGPCPWQEPFWPGPS